MKKILIVLLTLFFCDGFSQDIANENSHTVVYVVKPVSPEVKIQGTPLNSKVNEISKRDISYAKPYVVGQSCELYKLVSYEATFSVNGKPYTDKLTSSLGGGITDKIAVGGYILFDKIKFKDPYGKVLPFKAIKVKVVK